MDKMTHISNSPPIPPPKKIIPIKTITLSNTWYRGKGNLSSSSKKILSLFYIFLYVHVSSCTRTPPLAPTIPQPELTPVIVPRRS